MVIVASSLILMRVVRLRWNEERMEVAQQALDSHC